MKLSTDGWFVYYLGKIYGNKPTHINDRINNKQIITDLINSLHHETTNKRARFPAALL